MEKNIVIKGAKEHNLKNVNVEIPRDKLTVITGLSGSGKSSLAFDTIYAEGQRRYVESLSSYARQFLGQMDKPAVEYISGLSPSISIDQKTTSKNPRSTVGTVTEIYDYCRLLFARVGLPHCVECGKEIKKQSIDQIIDKIMELPENTKIQILAPVVRSEKGQHKKILETFTNEGFVRARIDGEIQDLPFDTELNKNKKHSIEIVVDRIIINDNCKSRLSDSVETASKISNGLIIADIIGNEEILFSQNYACPEHGSSIEEMSARIFSFNNPIGACDHCTGLGVLLKVDPELIIPDKNLSISEGGIKGSGWAFDGSTIAAMYFEALAEKYKFSLKTPIKKLSKNILDIILYGSGSEIIKIKNKGAYGKGYYERPFEGVINNLERRFAQTKSAWIKDEISSYMSEIPCEKCKGRRLSDPVLSVTVGGINIDEFCNMPINQLITFVQNLKFKGQDKIISEPIIKEIIDRLTFLKSVGLEYLTLARSSATLSGGESQRIRLATQIGSSLMGVIYILDEPSIGLHQRDNNKLIDTLKHLRDIGNTVIVVEHDKDTMLASDHIIDVGPGAGVDGGNIIFSGHIKEIKKCKDSITGQYLIGSKKIDVPSKRRKGNGKSIKIYGAKQNNLKNLNVSIPLGTFTCVTGVSGSGKSSLVTEILYKHLAKTLNGSKTKPGLFEKIEGIKNVDKIINISQSPIGRTPRSNPATYTGVFTDIRELFASTNEAKVRGFNQSRFSFNVKGGRCEACEGDGIIKIEMHFLPDIFVPCDICKGKRYNRETLNIKYKGKNIYDILDMTVKEGLTFFSNLPKIYRKLKTLSDVGLSYIKIGQPATTLSGGEAQRIKLATELSKRSTGKTIYILDEPTTGLHAADVHKLVDVLHRIVDSGNTVLVIEHNLDLIKTADYIIDLGPEGGENGGCIVAKGTPEKIASTNSSYTGQYLKNLI